MNKSRIIYPIIATIAVLSYTLYIVFKMDEINYLKITGVLLVFFIFSFGWLQIYKAKRKKNIK